MPIARGCGSRGPSTLATLSSSLQPTTHLMSRELVTGSYRGGKNPAGHHDYGDLLSKELLQAKKGNDEASVTDFSIYRFVRMPGETRSTSS